MLKFITGILALAGLVTVILFPSVIDRFPELSQLLKNRDRMGVMPTEQFQTPEEFTDQVPEFAPHSDLVPVLPDRGGRSVQKSKIPPQTPNLLTPGQGDLLIATSEDEARETFRLTIDNERKPEPSSEDRGLVDIQNALALYESRNHQ